MGICQSSALKVTVYDPENQKKTYRFSMKQMRTFNNLKDVLNAVNITLDQKDHLYYQTHIGYEELTLVSAFQIKDLVIKNNYKVLKYRVIMEGMY